jgi:hypothetical protein
MKKIGNMVVHPKLHYLGLDLKFSIFEEAEIQVFSHDFLAHDFIIIIYISVFFSNL